MGQSVLFILKAQDKITKTLEKVQGAFTAVQIANKKFNKELRSIQDYSRGVRVLPNTISRIKQKMNGLEQKLENTFDPKSVRIYRKELNKLQRELNRIEAKAKPLGQKIREGNNLTSSLMGLAGGGAFFKGVIETTSQFEKMRAVLNNTMGKVAGDKAWDTIQNFAQKTPYQLDEVFDSYIKLVNRGLKPTKEQLTSIGDLAASMGKPYDQLVEAILDAQTFEFERLKEFGIKAQKQGDKIAFTFKGQTKVVDATSDAVTNYILSLGRAKGVTGAMAAMSNTLGGKLSNLQDNFTKLKYKIGQMFLPMLNTGVKAMNKALGFLQKHPNLLKALTAGIIAVAGALAIYLPLQWALNIAMSANPIGMVIVGIGLLIAALVYVTSKIQVFINMWKKVRLIFLAINPVFALIVEGVLQLLKAVNYAIKYGLKEGLTLWLQELINSILKVVNKAIEFANKHLKKNWKTFELVSWVDKEELEAQKKAKDKVSGVTNLKKKQDDIIKDDGGGNSLKDKTQSGVEAITSGGAKNINISIEKLIEKFEIVTENIDQGLDEIEEKVAVALLRAVNSANQMA